VFLDGEVLEEVRLIGHECQPASGFERVLDQVVAVDADAAGGRAQNAGEGSQRRGLAGAVGTDQPDDLAGGDGERQVVDRGERAGGGRVGASEMLDSDGHYAKIRGFRRLLITWLRTHPRSRRIDRV